MPSRRPHRPREGPAREKAESALNDKKTPKINNWIRNSPITGFKTHLQNQVPLLTLPSGHATEMPPGQTPSTASLFGELR